VVRAKQKNVPDERCKDLDFKLLGELGNYWYLRRCQDSSVPRMPVEYKFETSGGGGQDSECRVAVVKPQNDPLGSQASQRFDDGKLFGNHLQDLGW
jgi:hypothetical protein